MNIPGFISDFFSLLYPRLCESCLCNLVKNEEILCTNCLHDLPLTNFHNDPDNEVARIFWGRVYIENATAYFHFHKGGHIQKLLHRLKYKGQKEIGIFLGKMIGHGLMGTDFATADLIVPVPLHPKKQRTRGFNQSEIIARGLSQVLHKPVDTQSLKRIIANPSQTHKHRYERWLNTENIFQLRHPETVKYKHILLVDDVITTGATLESCASELLKGEQTKVSIVVVANA